MASLLISYDPRDTFLRYTCEKKTDNKASPRGGCSPFIQQRVMKAATKIKHLRCLTWNYSYFSRTIICKSAVLAYLSYILECQ